VKKPLASLLTAALLASSAPLHAQTFCPTPLGAASALATTPASARLAFIQSVMGDQAKRARTWMWSWSLIGLGLSAGNFTLAALAKTPDDRVDPLTGGVTSLFIPAAIIVKPLRVSSANDELAAYVAETTTTLGPMGPCRQLAVAEQLLAESADDEALGVGILTHGIAIVGNTAIGLFLGIGFKHWGGALLNGLGGLAISEVEIFTQPTGAVHALERYRLGDLPAPAASTITWTLAPRLELGGAGITFLATF